jgi:LmbE family N-acetylglucosaminyl deacetylase
MPPSPALRFVLALAVFLLAPTLASGQSAADILHELRTLQTTGRVLHVAAHPDDENTQLIAYFAQGRGFGTAYLSMTRGEGGQNLIGPELGDGLGLIRSYELIEARKLDGGIQFFTSAPDFGYSRSPDETLERWNHDTVLADVVKVIRTFRPDVIVTRFSPDSAGETHGHHTASAILTLEAFRRAGDPDAFPEQLADLEPFQPKRIVWNRWGQARAEDIISIDLGGFDALTGRSFGETAALSRSMHRSQGFGAVGTRGERLDEFILLAGEPATFDIFDGVDTSWNRWPGGEGVESLIRKIIASFDPLAPSENIGQLVALATRIEALPSDPILAEKLQRVDRLIAAAAGLYVETTVANAEVTPGESVDLHHTAIVRSNTPVRWIETRVKGGGQAASSDVLTLAHNQAASRSSVSALPRTAQLTQPFWLALAQMSSAEAIRPKNGAAIPIEHVFEIGGRMITLEDGPVQVARDPVYGEIRTPLRVIPPAFVGFAESVELVAPGESLDVIVDVAGTRPNASGTVRLDLPDGWSAAPSARSFQVQSSGDRARLSFTLTAPATQSRAEIGASVVIDGREYNVSRQDIRYDHIPAEVLLPPAQLIAISASVATRGQRIAFVPGAGDAIPDALRRMGYEVEEIGGNDFNPAVLARFDAVVFGIRAFNVRDDLNGNMQGLFDWVEEGGNVVIQYQINRGMTTDRLAPFDLRIGRDRITQEWAELTPLAPDHPVLAGPNEIGPEDFEGWIQERGLYFAQSWDDAFLPIFEGADPNVSPSTGSLVIARHGEGFISYTGLSFFRQLPAGVPGAYRLFANLVSLGQ